MSYLWNLIDLIYFTEVYGSDFVPKIRHVNLTELIEVTVDWQVTEQWFALFGT